MNQWQNQNTQPLVAMKVFNNWNAIAKGWYIACPSRSLPPGKTKSLTICGQRIVVFRGDDGSVRDRPFERGCHHHICMMNGIDAQHLRTVHKIDVHMELDLRQNRAGNSIDFTLRGRIPNTGWRERIARSILGEQYEYSMRYADGCLGLLTMMKDVKFFPPLHMLYAYTPIALGKTRIWPIYVTEKRKGLWRWSIARFLLFCTKLAYDFLKGEDGKIYDNIRFHPNAILPIDAPIVKYMEYANQLEPSMWSGNFNYGRQYESTSLYD